MVKSDFHMMNILNLMDGDFIYRLYETQGDDLFFQTKFVQFFIKYAWETEVQYTLRSDMIIHVIFIFVHFLNMFYMNNEACGNLSDDRMALTEDLTTEANNDFNWTQVPCKPLF